MTDVAIEGGYELVQRVNRLPFTYNDSTHVYMFDSQRCRSVTNIAKIPTDDYTVNQWRHRMAAIGFAMRPDLIEDVAAHIDDNNRVNDVVQMAIEVAGANQASRRGTQLHAAAERGDLDQPLITEQQQRDNALWDRTLDAYGLVVEPSWVERVVLYPSDRIAGRIDRYMRFAHSPDFLVDADIKTGTSSVRYPHGTAVQLALHVNAPLIQAAWHNEGELEVTTGWQLQPENLRRDIAYVLSMPTREDADLGTLYEFTLEGRYAGNVASRAAIFCRHFQLNDNLTRRIDPPLQIAKPEPTNVVPLAPQFSREALQGTLRARIDLLNDNEKSLLRMAWDVAILGSIRAEMSLEQIAAANELVDTFDAFAQEAKLPEAPRTLPDEPAPRWTPNEGPPMPEHVAATLKVAYEGLDDAHREAVNTLVSQSMQHNCSLHIAADFAAHGTTYERRYWLVLGLMQLAVNDALDEEACRYLTASVVDAEWPFDSRLRPGAVVGLLGVEHAEAFCDLALALIAGDLMVDGNRLLPIPKDT